MGPLVVRLTVDDGEIDPLGVDTPADELVHVPRTEITAEDPPIGVGGNPGCFIGANPDRDGRESIAAGKGPRNRFTGAFRDAVHIERPDWCRFRDWPSFMRIAENGVRCYSRR